MQFYDLSYDFGHSRIVSHTLLVIWNSVYYALICLKFSLLRAKQFEFQIGLVDKIDAQYLPYAVCIREISSKQLFVWSKKSRLQF
jgi:hypothetical protein